jgi:16S rRNA (cytosine1402-N4)-methyltransferase
MRLDDSYKNITTASEILNKFPVKRIADIFYKYGDVRGSWSVARRIDAYRKKTPIIYTSDLLSALNTKQPKKLAPIFQSLRIYVNNEYDNLEKSLKDAISLLKKDGKIAAVSFHSGEDRIVKNVFREITKENRNYKLITKKPITPNEWEIAHNSRSRSAKLRILHRNADN